MDLWSLLKVVFRRWYVVLPLLVVTAYSASAMTDSIPPEYEVTGALLLVGPAPDDELALELTGPDNRLLQLSGSLGTVAEAIGLTIDSERVRSEFADQGLLPSYQLGTDSRSPIMQFLVSGEDAELTVLTMAELMTFVETELDETQAELGTPIDDRIEVQRISEDNEPSTGISSRRRAQTLLLVVGILSTLATAVVVDALVAARRRRQQARASSGAPAHPEPPTDEEGREPASARPPLAEVGPPPSPRRDVATSDVGGVTTRYAPSGDVEAPTRPRRPLTLSRWRTDN